MMRYSLIFVCSIFALKSHSQISIDHNFPGGNVKVVGIESDTVFFAPDLRDTEGDWFYWYFRATSNQPQTWIFKATRPNVLTSMGASYSLDGGKSWQWISREDHLDDDIFSFSFSEPDQSVRLSIAQPYTEVHLNNFLDNYKDDRSLKRETFCESRSGRPVEVLYLSNFDRESDYKILFTARHHACEMMASYVMEGIVEALLSDSPAMKKLLDRAEIMIIPFVDKDGVEAGDQGKNRKPRDHNRDYSGQSLYAVPAKLREDIPGWVENKPWMAIDLHNPWIRNKDNEQIFFVGKNPPALEKEQVKLAEILENTRRGHLNFNAQQNFLPFGEGWNNTNNYEQGAPFVAWAAAYFKKGLLVTTTIEFPYALNGEQVITRENSRLFGQDLIYAVDKYLLDHE